jgi:hypothetical protein
VSGRDESVEIVRALIGTIGLWPYHGTAIRHPTTLAALRDVLARLEAAEEDSRRLDWIGGHLDDFSSACSTRDGGVWLTVHGSTPDGDIQFRYLTLRDAIDAAREESP